MDIFGEEKFSIFMEMLNNVYAEFKQITDDSFHGNINEYVENNKYNPYGVSVSMQEVIDFVDVNFLNIANSVSLIFENVNELEDTMDRFLKYYHHLLNVIDKQYLTVEDKTWVIALDLIFIYKNNRNNTLKKVVNVLRSMCNFPHLGALVQVTNNVLK